MNEATKQFLGEDVVNSLPIPKQFNPLSVGAKLPNDTTACVSQTRKVTTTPELIAAMLMSNEWYQSNKGRIPNRAINESRVLGELTLLYDLMEAGNFASHRSTLGVTEDGRLVEGQGRLLAQLKSGKTYEYTVDVVKNDQRSVSQYLGSTRGTTATTSLSQLWEITFGLTKKQAVIAQQVFNGTIWHEEGILGATERSSTKAAVCQQETLPADIREVAVTYSSTKVPKGISASALATIELLALRKGHALKKVEAFRVGIITGTELKARDPRFVVREFLTRRQQGKNIRFQAQVGYLKSAFDKFITGSDMSKVSSPEIVSF
jgi:hypothetical protein